MNIFKLTVKEEFCAAHRLKDYDGECANLHGHTWEVEVTVQHTTLWDNGIAMDFKDIKKSLKALLPDHKCLNEVYDFNPTAENLAKHFYWAMNALGFDVVSVTVHESNRAKVEYSYEDDPDAD